MNRAVLCFCLYGSIAASHRVRFLQFSSQLKLNNIQLQISSLLDNIYLQSLSSGLNIPLFYLAILYYRRFLTLLQPGNHDLYIVYAELFPLIPAWVELLFLRKPYIFDFDDAFYLKYRTGRFAFLKIFLGAKIDRLLSSAYAVTAGNSILADYARQFNSNVVLLPSVVDTDRFHPIGYSPSSSIFTVGWIGSPSTSTYLKLLVNPLRELAKDLPVRLLVIGGSPPVIEGVDIIYHQWCLNTEVSLIQQFNVGVMPLTDSDWSRGKCAYKLIQCMSCGIPVIGSPVGANVTVVQSNCGFLAQTDNEWLTALRILALKPSLRIAMGAAARERIVQHYSIESAMPSLLSVLR